MAFRIVSILVILALAALQVFAGPVRENSFTGSSNGSEIILRWISDDESGVLRYELERKAGVSGQFFLLSEIAPRGNQTPYEYIDDSAFRGTESMYQYRLKVVFGNGSASMVYGPITVLHNPNTVRRTWGSIKAMFR
jgi:hypothetical protein